MAAGRPRKQDRPPRELTRAALEAAALRYLDRFDCTAARLKSVLMRRIAPGTEEALRQSARRWIEELLERYQSSGLLDDRRFAQHFSERQRERGASRRMIQFKLRARGVSAETVHALTASSGRGDELEAAIAFAKRRRLGPYRAESERVAKRSKDLAAMARAGFERDTALRAIGHAPSGDDEL